MVNHGEKPEIKTLFRNQDLPTVVILAPVIKLEQELQHCSLKTELSIIHFIINKTKQLVCVSLLPKIVKSEI